MAQICAVNRSVHAHAGEDTSSTNKHCLTPISPRARGRRLTGVILRSLITDQFTRTREKNVFNQSKIGAVRCPPMGNFKNINNVEGQEYIFTGEKGKRDSITARPIFRQCYKIKELTGVTALRNFAECYKIKELTNRKKKGGESASPPSDHGLYNSFYRLLRYAACSDSDIRARACSKATPVNRSIWANLPGLSVY